MSESETPRPTLTPDEALPRVEPPGGAFIVQLFVVPAVIVMIIVAVWVLFNWLAQMGSDPKEYLEQIRRQNANSWIAAHNLAEELRTKPELRQNREVARELGLMLEESLATGGFNQDDIQLRVFLCRALGEFYVPEGMPALIKAANVQRRNEDIDVRRSALEAVALLVSHVREQNPSSSLNEAELTTTLLAASREDVPQLREGAAYALGVLGGREATDRLVEMLGDVEPNARYNAATGLARQGRAESLPVLVEMLDVDDVQGVAEEEGRQAQDFKRALIVINGLRAARQLVDKQPDADVASLRQAVDDLLASDLTPAFEHPDYVAEVRAHAKALREHLDAR